MEHRHAFRIGLEGKGIVLQRRLQPCLDVTPVGGLAQALQQPSQKVVPGRQHQLALFIQGKVQEPDRSGGGARIRGVEQQAEPGLAAQRQGIGQTGRLEVPERLVGYAGQTQSIRWCSQSSASVSGTTRPCTELPELTTLSRVPVIKGCQTGSGLPSASSR